jgi:hypothetical protein
MKRQTQKDRLRIKTELADEFLKWECMTDSELEVEVRKKVPALLNGFKRDHLLRFLVLNRLDKIN